MEKHTNESITNLLKTSNKAVERAMVVLYDNRYYIDIEDIRMVMHFACYVQGWNFINNKPMWEPKSLTNPHCHRSFIKSGILPADSVAPIEQARELAIRNVSVLVALSNKEEILKSSLLVWVSSGRYRDTVNCIAVLESDVASYPEVSGWPFKRKLAGKPDSSHYRYVMQRFPNLKLSEESFLERYTLIEETDCYLD